MKQLFLVLFHGRNQPDEHMDDWGFDGPDIGPLQYCHTTYACHIKLAPLEGDTTFFTRYPFLDPQFPELNITSGLLVCDGKYYGDWSCYLKEYPDGAANRPGKTD